MYFIFVINEQSNNQTVFKLNRTLVSVTKRYLSFYTNMIFCEWCAWGECLTCAILIESADFCCLSSSMTDDDASGQVARNNRMFRCPDAGLYIIFISCCIHHSLFLIKSSHYGGRCCCSAIYLKYIFFQVIRTAGERISSISNYRQRWSLSFDVIPRKEQQSFGGQELKK